MSAARKILTAQFILGIVSGIAGWLLFDAVAGYSAALGGAICVIPNVYLAARMKAATLSGDAAKMLRATWLGEIGKILITAVLFTVVFVGVRPVNFAAVIVGFIVAHSGIWWAILRDPDGLS
ncbi:MAG: ATP synthase subunit I [Gammaproteobacteria bacterium]